MSEQVLLDAIKSSSTVDAMAAALVEWARYMADEHGRSPDEWLADLQRLVVPVEDDE